MKDYRKIVFIPLCCLLVFSCGKDDDPSVIPAESNIPEEFTLNIRGFGPEVIQFDLKEDPSSELSNIIEIAPSNTNNGFYIDLYIPANLSYSGVEEKLALGMVNASAEEDPWTFPDEYPLLTPIDIPYAERYAFMSYIFDDEENTFYDSYNKLQPGNKVIIEEVKDGRIKGSFKGDLLTPSRREAIEVWGSFNARLDDRELELE